MQERAVILQRLGPQWATQAHAQLLPGGHLVVVGGHVEGLKARRAGFEVRDSLFVVSHGGAVTTWLFRKPCEESTVAAQMLKTGTGALNIDGCRIGSGEILQGGGGKLWSHFRDGTGERAAPKVNMGLGRWPANGILMHKAECHQDGVRKVKPGNGSGRSGSGGDPNNIGYGGFKAHRPAGGFVDEDGNETVPAWVCTFGCPAAALDEQSGSLTSGTNAVRRSPYTGYHGGDGVTGAMEVGYGDTGGASRFYPQFENEDAFRTWFCRLVGLTE